MNSYSLFFSFFCLFGFVLVHKQNDLNVVNNARGVMTEVGIFQLHFNQEESGSTTKCPFHY